MIFVTVGTSSWDFTRLIKEMDRIAGNLDEVVIMQISEIKYEPTNTKYFRFTSNEEIEELYKKARIVVSHAGIGCIVTALGHDKIPIVVPRQKRFGEHIDDHQIGTAKELEKEGKIKVVYNIENLENTLKEMNLNHEKINKDKRLTLALKKYITTLENHNY